MRGPMHPHLLRRRATAQKKPPPDARITKIREYEDKLQKMQLAAKASAAPACGCAAHACSARPRASCGSGDAAAPHARAWARYQLRGADLPWPRGGIKREHLNARSQEEGKLGAVAAWEHKTGARIAQNAADARFEALRAARAAEIGARRERLARKLAEEDAALRAELAAGQQSPAERRAAMAARAREMAARREAERQVGAGGKWNGTEAAAKARVGVHSMPVHRIAQANKPSVMLAPHTPTARRWLRSCWTRRSATIATRCASATAGRSRSARSGSGAGR